MEAIGCETLSNKKKKKKKNYQPKQIYKIIVF